MTSASFGSLNIQSSSASMLGCPWTACDQVLGGGYFMSAVEMAIVSLQVATLVVTQEYQRMRLLLRLSRSCLQLWHSWSGLRP
jgi:hypothetical protein